jgi:hypothetical protein
MILMHALHDWEPDPGSVVSWQPSPAARAKAVQAPISAVPASYQQARHLRGYLDHAARGLDMSRLWIAAWDIPGQCDRRAMTHVINAHLRRHDTYHSWFEYPDAEHIARRTISDLADIDLIPSEHGQLTPAEFRDHILATPDPLQWDCFRFGIIQRADHFTFYASVDHIHVDPMFMAAIFMEIHMMYLVLVDGGAPFKLPEPGSYDDYCVRQHRYTAALTAESSEVREWIEFFENNDNTLPGFPLPLGDPSVPCTGDLVTVPLMDAQMTRQFEAVCVEAGARFSGGVFACAALTEHELTGAATYYGITPCHTRSTPAEFMTVGWFTGLVPITIPLGANPPFADAARAAQTSFDSNTGLAQVPFDRILELAPWLRRPKSGNPTLSYLDGGLAPLSSAVVSKLQAVNARFYADDRFPHRVNLWVNRFEDTSVTVMFPDNPVARQSVSRYIAVMKSIYLRIADGSDSAMSVNVADAFSRLG